jgi:hypothetical protein
VWILTLTTPAAAEAGVRQVHIALVGKLVEEPVLPVRFTSWFDAAEYQVSVSEHATLDTEQVLSPPPDGAVYVWVTLRHDDEAWLYFATATGDRAPSYAVREVKLEFGLDEVGSERLSQIVHLSTLALFEGQGEHERSQVALMLDEEPAAVPAAPVAAPAPSRAPSPPVPPPPPVAPAAPVMAPAPSLPEIERRPFDLEFGLGYAVSPRSDEGLWHGPALHAGLRLESSIVFELEGQGFLPHEEYIGAVLLRFWGVGLGVGAGWGARWGAGGSFSAALGPRIEVVDYEPQASLASEVSVAQGETELRPEVGITGRLGVSGSSLGAGLFVRVAYALSRTHYDVKTATAEREVASPSRFLPTAGLELIF